MTTLEISRLPTCIRTFNDIQFIKVPHGENVVLSDCGIIETLGECPNDEWLGLCELLDLLQAENNSLQSINVHELTLSIIIKIEFKDQVRGVPEWIGVVGLDL